jgi:hypothetical protein
MLDAWPTKPLTVASLQLDHRNPRLGRGAAELEPRQIVQLLFLHDKALDIAESIATRGYFPNEPLLAIKEGAHHVVVEGNRRLAALKALADPTVLEGALQRKLKSLAERITDTAALKFVPVTVAPDRRATDRQIAGRHVGTPVLAWEAESRATFILTKLEEGYTTAQLKDELGFSASDVQAARQTKAIAEMTRALDLADDVKKKLESPHAKVLSTIERVFDSTVGREFMHAQPDADHGLRISTSKEEFARAMARLVTDVATGRQTSRNLNSNEDIKKYFHGWKSDEWPKASGRSLYPSAITGSAASTIPPATGGKGGAPKKMRKKSETVLPRDFKVNYGAHRLGTIRDELVRIKRDEFPNAGAVLLRVFVELAVTDYLERTGELNVLVADLKSKNKLPGSGQPSMRHLAEAIIKVAKKELDTKAAEQVEKALKVDKAARFNLSELHSFVHNSQDHPTGHDLLQFWKRTEPLFRRMLEDGE